jgi:hypothetical protein
MVERKRVSNLVVAVQDDRRPYAIN